MIYILGMSSSPEQLIHPPRRIHWSWWIVAAALFLVALAIILGILWIAMKIYVP